MGPEVKEACGVFGVYAPGSSVANLAFDGLFALQHRGQESAGMAVGDGDTITVVKDMGLVATVFDERTLSGLEGHLAVGHTRYSTHGSSDWANAQPVYRGVGRAGFALGHNGNLTNTAQLGEKVGMLPGSMATDSDVVAELLAQAFPETEDLAARAPGRVAHRRRCVLLRADDTRTPLRCPRPARLPPALSRPARSGRRPLGVGAGVGVSGAQRHRRHLRPRAATGRARRDRRGRPSEPPGHVVARRRAAAVHLRVRLHRPARHEARRP